MGNGHGRQSIALPSSGLSVTAKVSGAVCYGVGGLNRRLAVQQISLQAESCILVPDSDHCGGDVIITLENILRVQVSEARLVTLISLGVSRIKMPQRIFDCGYEEDIATS